MLNSLQVNVRPYFSSPSVSSDRGAISLRKSRVIYSLQMHATFKSIKFSNNFQYISEENIYLNFQPNIFITLISSYTVYTQSALLQSTLKKCFEKCLNSIPIQYWLVSFQHCSPLVNSILNIS